MAIVCAGCAASSPAPFTTTAPSRAGARERQVIATGRVRVLLARRAASTSATEAASGMAPDTLEERDALAAAELERAFGVVEQPEVSELMLAIQSRVGQACEVTRGWDVIVLDVRDEANAMSLPSGQVFVTTGLLSSTRDEAEAAAVIAHELGHVRAQHARSHDLLTRDVAAASAAGTGRLGDSGEGLSRVTGLGAAIVVGEHGRAQELEADRFAASCLVLAGYDPDALIDLIDRQRTSDPRVFGHLERAHPSDGKRARALRRARAAGIFTSGGDRGDPGRHARALKMIENLARESE